MTDAVGEAEGVLDGDAVSDGVHEAVGETDGVTVPLGVGQMAKSLASWQVGGGAKRAMAGIFVSRAVPPQATVSPTPSSPALG